jgi:hypothetical protein
MVSTAERTNSVDAQGSTYVIGYLVAAAMMLVLWLVLYGTAFTGHSSGVPAARHCAEIADQAARLACYDSANHSAQRPPGRGYAPVPR